MVKEKYSESMNKLFDHPGESRIFGKTLRASPCSRQMALSVKGRLLRIVTFAKGGQVELKQDWILGIDFANRGSALDYSQIDRILIEADDVR